MVLGLSLQAFTLLHVIISVIAIVSGLVVLYSMLRGRLLPALTALFLATTILTSVTGFLFPFGGFTPAIAVGIVSVIILAVALIALYGFGLQGRWRSVYVATAIIALWLNVFVLVAQSFQKVAFLHRFAPTGSEPAFAVTQAVVLVAFALLGFVAMRRFHPERAA